MAGTAPATAARSSQACQMHARGQTSSVQCRAARARALPSPFPVRWQQAHCAVCGPSRPPRQRRWQRGRLRRQELAEKHKLAQHEERYERAGARATWMEGVVRGCLGLVNKAIPPSDGSEHACAAGMLRPIKEWYCV